MPQQVAHLLEGRRLRQIVDVVPAVGEDAALAIQITDRRRRRDNVLETAALGFIRCCCGHSAILLALRDAGGTSTTTMPEGHVHDKALRCPAHAGQVRLLLRWPGSARRFHPRTAE